MDRVILHGSMPIPHQKCVDTNSDGVIHASPPPALCKWWLKIEPGRAGSCRD